MGAYASTIGWMKRDLDLREELEVKVKNLSEKLDSLRQDYIDMVDAQRILATIADDNTEATLSFITGVVNKTLSEIFRSDTRKITLKKKLFAGTRPHIVVELTNGRDEVLDLSLQSGTGLKQVVSGLFLICLVEVRKARRIVIFDEKFSGLHKEAKRVLSEIIKIFAEGGFQFIFVEYGMNDIGKIYNVEKIGEESKVFALEGGQEYNDSDIFLFSENPDIELDENYDESEEIEEEGYLGEKVIE